MSSAIEAEREMLSPISERADVSIDTSDLSAPRGCARSWPTRCCRAASIGRLAVTFLTFGFKHGTPGDADLTFDVRFLPNPHYEAELRDLTGLDDAVQGVRGRRPTGSPSSTVT